MDRHNTMFARSAFHHLLFGIHSGMHISCLIRMLIFMGIIFMALIANNISCVSGPHHVTDLKYSCTIPLY